MHKFRRDSRESVSAGSVRVGGEPGLRAEPVDVVPRRRAADANGQLL